MSIAEAGVIATGYIVAENITDKDTWCCIMDVNIIDGLICYYTEIDDYDDLMVNGKKEEEWTLVELEIADIYKERDFYKYLEEETEY